MRLPHKSDVTVVCCRRFGVNANTPPQQKNLDLVCVEVEAWSGIHLGLTTTMIVRWEVRETVQTDIDSRNSCTVTIPGPLREILALWGVISLQLSSYCPGLSLGADEHLHRGHSCFALTKKKCMCRKRPRNPVTPICMLSIQPLQLEHLLQSYCVLLNISSLLTLIKKGIGEKAKLTTEPQDLKGQVNSLALP